MTPQAALIELMDRIATLPGEKTLIRNDELSWWPIKATEVLKSHNLIRKSRPAASVVCDECEKECLRPVHTPRAPSGDLRVFIVRDKLDDVDRVPVPIERLEQWQTSGALVAEMLAGLLGLVPPVAQASASGRWEVGLLKGKKHSSHLVLMAGDALSLALAGYSVPLSDVLILENNQITIDKRKLTRLVDQPVAGAGDVEFAEQRRERVKKRVNELKARCVKAFLKTVAEEGLSTWPGLNRRKGIGHLPIRWSPGPRRPDSINALPEFSNRMYPLMKTGHCRPLSFPWQRIPRPHG